METLTKDLEKTEHTGEDVSRYNLEGGTAPNLEYEFIPSYKESYTRSHQYLRINIFNSAF